MIVSLHKLLRSTIGGTRHALLANQLILQSNRGGYGSESVEAERAQPAVADPVSIFDRMCQLMFDMIDSTAPGPLKFTATMAMLGEP